MNEGRTALWPIYVDAETHKIIDTVTGLSQPISQEAIEYGKTITEGIISDPIKAYAIEIGLTCNSPVIKDNLDFINIAYDNQTDEVIQFIYPDSKTEPNEQMDRLIKMLENACYGNDGEGNANTMMTAIANVLARYCALDPGYLQSFLGVVDFWKKQKS